MKWISTKERLPEDGKYVLARHNRGTWHDRTDQENVNCVVVKLVRGISLKERKDMKDGNVPVTVYKSYERWEFYMQGDESDSNKVPYEWATFGPDSFGGESITHWTPIKPLPNE